MMSATDAAFWTILTFYTVATIVVLALLRRDSRHHDPIDHPQEQRSIR